MTSELFRLFSEGGGDGNFNRKDSHFRRYSAIRPGMPVPDSAPWHSIAQRLAAVQDEALEGGMAEALASASEHADHLAFRELRERAALFLQSHTDERQEAVRALLDARERLQEKFGIAPWEAYWSILLSAFRTQVSPLGLVQSLVRELEQDAA